MGGSSAAVIFLGDKENPFPPINRGFKTPLEEEEPFSLWGVKRKIWSSSSTLLAMLLTSLTSSSSKVETMVLLRTAEEGWLREFISKRNESFSEHETCILRSEVAEVVTGRWSARGPKDVNRCGVCQFAFIMVLQWSLVLCSQVVFCLVCDELLKLVCKASKSYCKFRQFPSVQILVRKRIWCFTCFDAQRVKEL